MSTMFKKPIKGYVTRKIEKKGLPGNTTETFEIGVPFTVRTLKDYDVAISTTNGSHRGTVKISKATSRTQAVTQAVATFRRRHSLPTSVALVTTTTEIHHAIGATV